MHILIVGLGLIGGSFAKAIKQKTGDVVTGMDRSRETLEQALAEGTVDRAAEAVPADTDLVLIALYPRGAVEFIRRHREEIPRGSTVIDLCGVKRFVCEQAEELLSGRDVTFIGGHPMAGRERWGYEASLSTLFEGASMILTPRDSVSEERGKLVEDFFRGLGFGNITYTTPEHHDEVIALTSQLAHVVSSAYVQDPMASGHMGFSAGSFQDMTRVAKLREEMWTELFLLNADCLAERVDSLIQRLEGFREAIAAGDAQALQAMLRAGRETKERLLVQ